MITKDTTVSQIERMRGFERFAYNLMSLRPSTHEAVSTLSVGKICEDFHTDRILVGLQRVEGLIDAGVRVDYDFWTPQDVAEEPDRAETKLIFMPGRKSAPFVLFLPGGAYQSVCALMEGFPAGAELNERGYNVFVLSYRVRKEPLMPKPLDDAAKALEWIMRHAEELGVSREFAIMGGSAGGHLAAETCTGNLGLATRGLPVPQALVLCYPVVDASLIPDNKTGRQMRESLPGDDYVIPRHIASSWPSTYLWQCEDDAEVSFDQFLALRNSLAQKDVDLVTATYGRGGHGMQGEHDDASDRWMEPILDFLEERLPIA